MPLWGQEGETESPLILHSSVSQWISHLVYRCQKKRRVKIRLEGNV